MITIKAMKESSTDFTDKKHEIDIDIFEDWAIQPVEDPIDEDEINNVEDLKNVGFCIDDDIFTIKKDELKKLIEALQLTYENIEKAEKLYGGEDNA